MMHPIVLATDPNDEQQPAVLDRGRDVVVTAGAGTGKTRTLVSRYLSLLADGIPLRSIVAITFTRKAAREMRNRVRSLMRDFLGQESMTSDERWRWQELYNGLDAARIGTIHSLATEILRAHPAEAGVDPRFEVLDEGLAGILVAQAVDYGLTWAVDDSQAVALFSFLGERRLRSLLESLMGQRLEAREALLDLPTPVWPLWQDLLLPPIIAFVDDISVRSAFDDLLALRADGTLYKAEAAGDALAPYLGQMLDLWETILQNRERSDWARLSASLHPLRQNMKLVGSKGNWGEADPKAIIRELRQLFDESLVDLGQKPINLALDREWAVLTPQLRRLFYQITDHYSLLKGFGQDLDYDDLESGALGLLRDHPAVRARWQEEIQAVLVDEYQDTNGRQRDLVNLIAGSAGELFIVGDAKQSIYRFRGADVSVFRTERARIDQGPGVAYDLSTSYRAHQELLSGLNDLLEPVLGVEDDPDRPWREPFSPLLHHRQVPRKGVTDPFIELLLTVGSKGDGALDRAAEALASRIIDLVEGEDSEIGFGDIAILCRASTSFGSYESALDQAGVPYLTVAGRGFYERPEIRDLLNMLQAVSDPADNLAMSGLLRSPVVGFSDYDLYEVMAAWTESGRERPLWELLQNSTDKRAIKICRIVQDLHNRAGRVPAASILKQYVNETDYRAALLRSGNTRAARNVTKLLVDAHNSGMVSISQFLDYIKGLRSGPAREGEAPATVGDVVRIMTVHAAKGLEFPVVVIGDINYSRSRSANLLLDPDLGVFPSLSDDDDHTSGMFPLLKNREDDQEDAESERLLYVAATRAQDKLILSGSIKLTKSNQPGWLNGWLKKLDAALHFKEQVIAYDEEGATVKQLTLRAGETDVGCSIYEPGCQPPLRAEAQPAADFDAERWSPALLSDLVPERIAPSPAEEAERAWRVFPPDPKAPAPGLVVGTLVHEALAAWRFPEPGFREWIANRARSYGLTGDDQVADAAARAETLLERFRRHMLYGIMESAERRLAEIPYERITRAGKVEHRVIDALFLKDGIWTLVEYKTDELRSERDFERALDFKGYERQLNFYARAVHQLTGYQPRPILCLLDYRGEIRLHPRPQWL